MCFQFLGIGIVPLLVLFYKWYISKSKLLKKIDSTFEYDISYFGQCILGKDTCILGHRVNRWVILQEIGKFPSLSFCIPISNVGGLPIFPQPHQQSILELEYIGILPIWKTQMELQYNIYFFYYERAWASFHVLKGRWHFFFCELLPTFFIRLSSLFLYNF